jgi:hypothetical protein
MKEDVWSMGISLDADNYTFQAAMVLFASELVGPFVDRIATLLGYSPGLVQVIAARLHEAQIWEPDEVRCERWRDPEFAAQMVEVLHVYREVEIWREQGAPPPDLVAVLSYR